jgi:hypothetical protein
MRIAWVAIAAACGGAACRDVDAFLGAEDHEFLAIRLAEQQPEDPAHGVLANVVVFALRDGMLDVRGQYGSIQRAGEPAGPGFCQALASVDEPDPASDAAPSPPDDVQIGAVVPIVVFPEDTEVLLHVRLLDRDDADRDACDGTVREAISAFDSAPAGAEPPPDGAPDAALVIDAAAPQPDAAAPQPDGAP